MLGNEPIGFCQYYDCHLSHEGEFPAEQPNKVYSIDYLIGEEQYLRKGYCRQMVALMLSEIGSGKTIMALPDLENAASCNTLLSSRFSFDKKQGLYIKKT